MRLTSPQFRRVEVEDFRCFRGEVVMLAPLTLLVGENSTGKTSFLALLRAMWDVAYRQRAPDFREPPYDLGTFPDIAHERGRSGGRAAEFSAEFMAYAPAAKSGAVRKAVFGFRFEDRRGFPFPAYRRVESEPFWFEAAFPDGKTPTLRFRTQRGSWRIESGLNTLPPNGAAEPLLPAHFLFRAFAGPQRIPGVDPPVLGYPQVQPDTDGTPRFGEDDFRQIHHLLTVAERTEAPRPYASAPVRTYPQRTYDPTRPSANPEGEDTPTFFSDLHRREPREWQRLKGELENFGQASGLFDEISVKQLTKASGGPFQIQVRRFPGRTKGPQRNLMDVGYGVSQALPILAALLRRDAPPLFLLQQPEVHLHPTAQAALGDLLADTAARGKQVVVETHSDYLVDRVRMAVRDGATGLRPEDVSLLFFEQRGLDAQIHSLRYDELGNVLDAPRGYRKFFLEETQRSIGI